MVLVVFRYTVELCFYVCLNLSVVLGLWLVILSTIDVFAGCVVLVFRFTLELFLCEFDFVSNVMVVIRSQLS